MPRFKQRFADDFVSVLLSSWENSRRSAQSFHGGEFPYHFDN